MSVSNKSPTESQILLWQTSVGLISLIRQNNKNHNWENASWVKMTKPQVVKYANKENHTKCAKTENTSVRFQIGTFFPP